METKLYEINVTLSDFQKEIIFHVYNNREKVRLSLKNDDLTGKDTLLVPSKLFTWNTEEYNFNKGILPVVNSIESRDIKNFMILKENLPEIFDHGFKVITSVSDGVRKFTAYISPTVDESLEKARENKEEWILSLDYSLLAESKESIEYSVFKNIGKLMENIPSLEV